jgi:hypothetical protein
MTNIFVNKGVISSNAELKEHDVRGFKLTIKANKFLFFKPKYEVIFYDQHDTEKEYHDEGKMKSVIKNLLKNNEPEMAISLLFVGAALKDVRGMRKGRKIIIDKIGNFDYNLLLKNCKFDYTIL